MERTGCLAHLPCRPSPTCRAQNWQSKVDCTSVYHPLATAQTVDATEYAVRFSLDLFHETFSLAPGECLLYLYCTCCELLFLLPESDALCRCVLVWMRRVLVSITDEILVLLHPAACCMGTRPRTVPLSDTLAFPSTTSTLPRARGGLLCGTVCLYCCSSLCYEGVTVTERTRPTHAVLANMHRVSSRSSGTTNENASLDLDWDL